MRTDYRVQPQWVELGPLVVDAKDECELGVRMVLRPLDFVIRAAANGFLLRNAHPYAPPILWGMGRGKIEYGSST